MERGNSHEDIRSLLLGAKVEEASFKEDGTLEMKLEKSSRKLDLKLKEQPDGFSVDLSSSRMFFPYEVPFSLRFSSEDVEEVSDFLKREIAGKGFKVWDLLFGKEYFDGFFFEMELINERRPELRATLRINCEGSGENVKIEAFTFVPLPYVDEDENYGTRKILKHVRAEGKAEELY